LEVRPKHPYEYLAQIIQWKDEEIAQFRAYRNEEIQNLKSERFEIIREKALLTGEHEIVSQGQRYPFDAAIIATGSVTSRPRISGLDPSWEGVWTSDEILQNIRLPKSLAVIGVGAVGLEFALRYARLGSKVTMLARSQILPEFPQQFGDRIKTIYEQEKI